MIHVGFTGTRFGLSEFQERSLWSLLHALPEFIGHHGDCVGADATFGDLAHQLDRDITVHPPMVATFRANCRAETILHRLPYLERNAAIVTECDVMVACPETDIEQAGGGTWSTIRLARKVGKPLAIVMPDGTVTYERWTLTSAEVPRGC